MAIVSPAISGSSPLPSSIPTESLRRFTVDEYHALVASGFFARDEAYELLEGWLIHKMGKNRRHSLVTRRLRKLLEPLLQGCYVDSQEPMTTGDSEPEPNVYVVRGDADDYRGHHPRAQDVFLVVEVADATLARDRGLKKRIYARSGIPVYWIVNLIDDQVEVYTHPAVSTLEPTYQACQVLKAGDELPVVIDGSEIGRLTVAVLLP